MRNHREGLGTFAINDNRPRAALGFSFEEFYCNLRLEEVQPEVCSVSVSWQDKGTGGFWAVMNAPPLCFSSREELGRADRDRIRQPCGPAAHTESQEGNLLPEQCIFFFPSLW